MAASAGAQGAMLHGIGPVNSSMGGAGVALPNESLGALMFNPALIAGFEGNQVSFSTEFFMDSIRIDTTLFEDNPLFDGPRTGRMVPDRQLAVVPAFGYMMRKPGGKMALGFGVLGIAGFGVDYHQDDDSILFSQPPFGFGRIFTDYRNIKIPLALAYQVTPKLAVGASANLYIGEFAVAPLPYKEFDTSVFGARFYPEAGRLDKSWAVSGQLGFHYQHSPKMSVGASLTLPQNFEPYAWNSTKADPTSRDFGRARRLDFDLDGPMIVTFGTALKPNAKTQIALDGQFTKYKGVEGFGSPGGVVDRIVYPFGWRNVWTVKVGLQREVGQKLIARLGYNYSQMPLRKEVVLTATGAPATFQHHFCAGAGIKLFPFLTAESAFYFVPREHLVGPFPDLDNKRIGTLDESNALTSGLVAFNFRF
jgi:long-chain fatty acid transport protein